MESAIKELEEKGRVAKAASRKFAFLPTEIKNKALLDRLMLSQSRLEAMSQDVKTLAALLT